MIVEPDKNLYASALEEATRCAITFAVPSPRFDNALNDLRAATPHCDGCRWAVGRGHARWCKQP